MKTKKNIYIFMNEKLTDFQNKFNNLASDNEMLREKIIVAKKTTSTLPENLSRSNYRITKLKKSANKLEQYSLKEYAGIAGIP